MEKKTEEILAESVKKMQVEDFSAHWERIESRLDVAEKPARKKKFSWRRFASVAASFILVIGLLAIFPSGIQQEEKTYADFDVLTLGMVTDESVFYEGMENCGLSFVDFSKNEVLSYGLYYSEEGQVRGGYAEYVNLDNMAYVILSMYEPTVVLDEEEYKGGTQYQTGDADIVYLPKDIMEGTVGYIALAKTPECIYAFRYAGATDNVLEYFDDFFNEK